MFKRHVRTEFEKLEDDIVELCLGVVKWKRA